MGDSPAVYTVRQVKRIYLVKEPPIPTKCSGSTPGCGPGRWGSIPHIGTYRVTKTAELACSGLNGNPKGVVIRWSDTMHYKYGIGQTGRNVPRRRCALAMRVCRVRFPSAPLE